MKPVKSSQIKSVGYDTESKTLYVEFSTGAVYQYMDVPLNVYNEMLTPTVSVGSYFGAHVKGKFSYSKLDTAVAEGHIHV